MLIGDKLRSSLIKSITDSKDSERTLANLTTLSKMGREVKKTTCRINANIVCNEFDGITRICVRFDNSHSKWHPIRDFEVARLQSEEVQEVSRCLSYLHDIFCVLQIKLNMDLENVRQERDRAELLLTMRT